MLEPRNATESRAVSIPDTIPIFPLPNVVLFPDTYLPLHIFEPRYQDMVADTLKQEAYIGMALLQEGQLHDAHGNPAVCSPGCVGRITTFRPLRDGCSDLILHGLSRYTIEEELPGKSYRRAKIAVPSHHPFQTIGDDAVRSTLVELAVRYLQARQVQEVCVFITRESIAETVLVNSLSSCLDFTPIEKQFLLETESLYQQTRRLIDLLRLRLSDGLAPSRER
ncbi:MAG: LON peptidase substrate-binding domain-containing protein [Nitrospira sp.]|nr:LON peptidase substrate-binding domain-containing protein [Nitrospira sp.]MDD9859616.1 LON peptidase substrate-binding domain-containing protein [Nitrospira sp.]